MILQRIDSFVLSLGVMFGLVLAAYGVSNDNVPSWVIRLAVSTALIIGIWFFFRSTYYICQYLRKRIRQRRPRLPEYPTLIQHHGSKWEGLLEEITDMKSDLHVIYEQFLFSDSNSRSLSRFEIKEAYKNMVSKDIRNAARRVQRRVKHVLPGIVRHSIEVDAIASRWSEAGHIEWYNEIDIEQAQQALEVVENLLPRVEKGIGEAHRRQKLDLEARFTAVSKKSEDALTDLRVILLSVHEAATTVIDAWKMHINHET
jgi:hypothetical protein